MGAASAVDNTNANGGFGSVFAVQHGLTATHHDAAVHEAGIGRGCVKSPASLCWWETIGKNDCVLGGHPKFSPTQAHKMAKRC